jgi:FkbM family methyltransferase
LNRLKKLFNLILEPEFLFALLQTGTAAGLEHRQFLKRMNELGVKTIVDIGANRGQFALCARKVISNAEIFSIEPLSEPAKVFRRVFMNDHLTSLVEVAIGEKEEQRIIHVSQSDDSSSLLPISDLQTTLFPNTAEKEKREIQVKTLSDVITRSQLKQPALLKIDVQGYEKDVLAGAAELISAFSFIYVECSFVELYTGQALAHEVIAMLENHGFALLGIYNLSYDTHGIAIQGDFLFVNEKEGMA